MAEAPSPPDTRRQCGDSAAPSRHPIFRVALAELDLSGTLSDVAHRALRLVERRKIQSALAVNLGNKSKTAEDLGVSYKTLLNKLKDYSL